MKATFIQNGSVELRIRRFPRAESAGNDGFAAG